MALNNRPLPGTLAALFKNFIRERRANVRNSTRKQQHTDHLA